MTQAHSAVAVQAEVRSFLLEFKFILIYLLACDSRLVKDHHLFGVPMSHTVYARGRMKGLPKQPPKQTGKSKTENAKIGLEQCHDTKASSDWLKLLTALAIYPTYSRSHVGVIVITAKEISPQGETRK